MGEPGVGKSRLVYEFTHSHRTQDWLILEAGSVSYGKATSYLPVIDLLKAYFKVRDRETHREIREKVTGKLLTLDRDPRAEPATPCWRSWMCPSRTPSGRPSIRRNAAGAPSTPSSASCSARAGCNPSS